MLSNHPNVLGGNGPSASSDLIGDVDGPASATDNAVARFDGTTGKLIQNSVVTIADTTGAIAGAQSLTSPASTNLTLATGSFGTALTVASLTGNVGIGTISPVATLHVKGGQGSPSLSADTNNINVVASSTNAQLVTGAYSTSPYAIWMQVKDSGNNSASYPLVLNPLGGNVGIGTTGPTYHLHVAGTGTETDVATFRYDTGQIGETFISSEVTGGRIGIRNSAGTQVINIDARTNANSYFNSGGNVLIGTTDATGLTGAGGLKIASTTAGAASAGALVVAGGIGVAGASFFGNAVSITTTNVPNPFIIDSTSANLATLYKLAGTTKLILGVSAATNGINNGSVLGDPCFRTLGNILFSTDDGTTNALKLSASTGAATFAGAVNLTSASPELVMTASGGNPTFRFSDTTGTLNNRNWRFASNNTLSGDFVLLRSLTTGTGAGTAVLSFDRASDATFAGTVTVSSSTASTGVGTGALQVAGGIYAGAASVFGSTATFGSTSTNPYGSSTLYAKGTVSAPASSGTANTSSFRAGAGNNIVADFGITTTGGNAAYIQAHDQSDQSVNYGLQIQPNGGTTTFGTGAATFAGAVTAVSVNSATGSVSAPTATATTIFAASTRGMYQVFAYIDAYDPTSWAATAVVINTGEASTLKITATNNPSFTLTVSGLNVQVTQSGGSTLSVEWRYLRIQ